MERRLDRSGGEVSDSMNGRETKKSCNWNGDDSTDCLLVMVTVTAVGDLWMWLGLDCRW